MTYATQADLVTRFGEEDLIRLTDRADPPLDAIDSAVVAAALADAEAVIDGYVATRYTLPLATTPLLLRQIECDLAWFILQRGNPTEDAQKRQQAAIAMLRDVSKGALSLGPDAANAVPTDAGGVQVSAGDAVFTPSTLADY